MVQVCIDYVHRPQSKYIVTTFQVYTTCFWYLDPLGDLSAEQSTPIINEQM